MYVNTVVFSFTVDVGCDRSGMQVHEVFSLSFWQKPRVRFSFSVFVVHVTLNRVRYPEQQNVISYFIKTPVVKTQQINDRELKD